MLVKRLQFRVLLGIFCCFLLCSSGIAAKNTSDKQGQLGLELLKIDSFLHEGELEKGLGLANGLLDVYGEHPLYGWQLHGRAGLALIRMGEFSRSITHLEEAMAARPREPIFHRNLAFALVNMGQTGRALSEYTQAVGLDPDNATLRMELGQRLLGFKDFRRARIQLERASELCGGCEESTKALAQLYLASGSPRLAIPLFKSLVETDHSRFARRNVVQAMQEAGEDSLLVDFLGHWPAKELEVDELHLLINAERECGHFAYAMLYLQNRMDTSAPAISSLVEDRHQFWGEVAYSLMLAEKWDGALQGFDLALEFDPENHVYLNNRQVALDHIKKQKGYK